MPGNGHLAAAVETGQKAAFGFHADAGGGVFQLRQQREKVCSVLAAFNAQRALAHGRQKAFRVQNLDVGRVQAQAAQTGRGQHDGIVTALAQLAQTRVHIAAQALNAQVGPQGQQLGLTAQAAGAYAGPLRQGGQIGIPAGEQTIGWFFPTGNAA